MATARTPIAGDADPDRLVEEDPLAPGLTNNVGTDEASLQQAVLREGAGG